MNSELFVDSEDLFSSTALKAVVPKNIAINSNRNERIFIKALVINTIRNKI